MASLAKPRALLLDLDGTLADSLAVLRLAYRSFLEQFHIEPTDAEFDRLNGPPLADVVLHLKTTHALEGDVSVLLASYFDVIDRAYSAVAPGPGASELLQKARVNYCTVGVVTSNTAKRTHAWLESVRLLHLVDFVVSGDEVQKGKPDPEPYLLAVSRLSCALPTIVAVEDSLQGAQSAIAAGLKTFVLTSELGGKILWPQDSTPIRSLGALAQHLW